MSAPDPKADDLRKRLIDLLSRAKTEVEARPSPQPGPRRAPKLDEKLVGEFDVWKNEYKAWVKTAV